MAVYRLLTIGGWSVQERGAWPWRWEDRTFACRTRLPPHTCRRWSVLTWPCSWDSVGSLWEQTEEHDYTDQIPAVSYDNTPHPFTITFYLKKSQKSKLSLENKNLKWGEISLWNKCFFSNTCWTQLLVALEIIMSKIYLKYIPIPIQNFEHTSMIMNMQLSSHGFVFHRNINRTKQNKGQIPN